MNTQQSNTSNGINVSQEVEQAKQKNIWVIIQDGEEINANGQECSIAGLNDFMGGSTDADPSTYEEIVEYVERSPEVADQIGVYYNHSTRLEADTPEGAVELFEEKVQEKQDLIEEAKEEVDLSDEKINALLKRDKLLKYYNNEEVSYIDLAVRDDVLQKRLDEDGLREVNRRKMKEEYEKNNPNTDRWSGMPDDVEVELHNGRYCTVQWDDEHGKQRDYITNFRIDLHSTIIPDDPTKNTQYDVSVVPASPEDDDVRRFIIDGSAFKDQGTFIDTFCVGTSTSYDGSNREVGDIKRMMSHQRAPTRTIQEYIGLTPDGNMLTPEGVIDGEGWMDYEDVDLVFKNKYGSTIPENWDLGRDDDLEGNKQQIREIIKRVWRTREPEESLALIGYIYGAPFNRAIRDLGHDFPNLSITGVADSGKSKTIEKVLRTIMAEYKPSSFGKISIAAMRDDLATTTNLPQWYDEYIPARKGETYTNGFKQLIKDTIDHGKAKKKDDGETIQIPLRAPVIVSGEQYISGESDERRLIQTQFTKKAKTEAGTERFNDMKMMNSEYKEFRKEWWKFVAREYDNVEDMWDMSELEIRRWEDELDIEDVESLERVGLILVNFGVKMFKKFGEEMGVEESDLPTKEDVKDCIEKIGQSAGANNRVDYLDQFVTYLGDAIKQGYIHEYEEVESNDWSYRIVNKDGNKATRLHFELGEAYSAVSKYLRDHDLENELLSQDDYYTRLKNKGKQEGTYVKGHSEPTSPMGRRLPAINVPEAESQIDGFHEGKLYDTTEKQTVYDDDEIPDDLD